MISGILAVLMILTAVFLILLILVQRGRGGGLAGALGGMGGQSAFGTKAGDLFTRVTIGVAATWIILCVISVKLIGTKSSQLASDLGGSAPLTPDITLPVGEGSRETPGGAAEPGGAAGGGGPEGGAMTPGAGTPDTTPAPATGESKTAK